MRTRFVKNKDKEVNQIEKDSYNENKDLDSLEEKDLPFK
jgi:hypothetical protein